MRGINPKAILLATLAVLGIDLVSNILLTGIFGPSLDNPTDKEVDAAIAELFRNPNYLVMALILGTASTIVGGYLTARLARTVPYFNALAFGLLGIVLSVVLGASTDVRPPAWSTFVAFTLTVPAALLGAYLSKRVRSE